MADQATEGLLSPLLKRQRISAVLSHLKGSVLDVGCGSGALADHIDSGNYVGIDIDLVSIDAARADHPLHTFHQELRLDGETFDTVIALAVIECVSDPVAFYDALTENLQSGASMRVVCTTHRSLMWAGSQLSLFSRSANDEHEELLSRERPAGLGRAASLKLADYRRILFGVSQVVINGCHDS